MRDNTVGTMAWGITIWFISTPEGCLFRRHNRPSQMMKRSNCVRNLKRHSSKRGMADLGGTLPVRIQVLTWLIIGFWCWAWWSRTPLSSSAWQREGMVDGGGGVGDGDEEELEGESGGRVDVGDGGGDGLRRSPL